MAGKINIVRAESRHAAGVAEIVRDLGWLEHLSTEPFEVTEARVREQIATLDQSGAGVMLTAEDEGGLVLGFAAIHFLPSALLESQEGYLSELFVRADRRGFGVGGRLLDAVEAEARRRGCARLMLINGNDRESYARGFYRGRGWEERRRMVNFIRRLD